MTANRHESLPEPADELTLRRALDPEPAAVTRVLRTALAVPRTTAGPWSMVRRGGWIAAASTGCGLVLLLLAVLVRPSRETPSSMPLLTNVGDVLATRAADGSIQLRRASDQAPRRGSAMLVLKGDLP